MKNENTKTENKFIGLSMGIAALLLVMSLLSLLVLPVFSNEDTFQANVTVGNSAPTVSGVTLVDGDAGTIQLTISSATTVTCSATVTDLNGYSDITGANATIFYSNSTYNAADDINYHYSNSTCTLSGGTGTTETATCTAYLNFSAINGTWYCNVTAIDISLATGAANGTNTVDQLVALSIWNDTINFSAMTNGQNTTDAQAMGINISNEGNVRLDIDVKALSSEMSCSGSGSTCIGVIGVSNMTFNMSRGTYDNMCGNGGNGGFNLTTTNQTVTAFDLYEKGIGTVDELNSSQNLFWGIQIPQGVKGEFNVNITISALVG